MDNLILAGTTQDKLASWKNGLAGFDSSIFIKDKFTGNRMNLLRNEVDKIKPKALLLDFDMLEMDNLNDVAALRRLAIDTKVIVLADEIAEDREWELLKAGIRGCCRSDIASKDLNHAVMSVLHGELWIRRALISRLVDEMGSMANKNKPYRAPFGLINSLTQREYDIAVRVGNGQNNKQIANACGITERTVKAHLTEIFLKLGVTDRLNLALLLAADNRIDFTNSEGLLSDVLVQSKAIRASRARLIA